VSGAVQGGGLRCGRARAERIAAEQVRALPPHMPSAARRKRQNLVLHSLHEEADTRNDEQLALAPRDTEEAARARLLDEGERRRRAGVLRGKDGISRCRACRKFCVRTASRSFPNAMVAGVWMVRGG
jgi:hypothetical protein